MPSKLNRNQENTETKLTDEHMGLILQSQRLDILKYSNKNVRKNKDKQISCVYKFSTFSLWDIILKIPCIPPPTGVKKSVCQCSHATQQQQQCKQIKRLVNNKHPANYSSQDSTIRAESPHGTGKGTLSSQGRFLHISFNMMTQFANADSHIFIAQG